METAEVLSCKAKILLISKDNELIEDLKRYYRPRGYEIDEESIVDEALEHLRLAGPRLHYDLLIVESDEFGDGRAILSGLEVLKQESPIIVLSKDHSVETAMHTIRNGAFDFLSRPINFSYLSLAIERALADSGPVNNQPYAHETQTGVIAESPQMLRLMQSAKKVANSTSTVLIQGESGCGKEIVARTLHKYSPRSSGPFVALNCSAIPESLLESELFGYAKGAFTGANDRRIGLFEEASGGTLFLDEIGDLSLPLQAKLLRVIQERKIKRLGENQLRPIDVRLLAATHKDLNAEVHEGRFRQDLYFRLAVIKMHIPPLRERLEDILPLARHFLAKYASANHRAIKGFTPEAEEHLLRQSWSGNVRELENSIERAVVLCEEAWISRLDLPEFESNEALKASNNINQCGTAWPEAADAAEPNPWPGIRLDSLPSTELPSLEDISLKYVDFVLNRVGGVKERAARILKIDRKTLYRRIEDIHQADFV